MDELINEMVLVGNFIEIVKKSLTRDENPSILLKLLTHY